jgi:alpha-L-rhamnosidase
MAAQLAFDDYMATGLPDLFAAYEEQIYGRLDLAALDGTGLINTTTGRHLVGWDPPPSPEYFKNNAHTAVCNGWAVHGLEALATMASADGNAANASLYSNLASNIRAAMVTQMWDTAAGRFCDGPCSDPKVQGHGGYTTNYFTTFFGLVPEEHASGVWKELAGIGMTGIGDYGSFVFLNALAAHPGDDGTAMVTALTKCDAFSWCNEIVTYNATMTTESLGSTHQTMSHPWGTGAIPAIVHGVMGIAQTSPTWETFTVKPLLASLKFANITVPTIRGPITVSATPGRVVVGVPCNTRATVCIRAHPAASTVSTLLVLDGFYVDAHLQDNSMVCTSEPITCAVGARVLSLAS